MRWQITYVECFTLAVGVVKKVMVLKNRWCFSWWKTLVFHKWLIFTLWYDSVFMSEVIMTMTSKIETPIIIIMLAQSFSLIYGCAISLSIVFSVSNLFFSSNEDILVW